MFLYLVYKLGRCLALSLPLRASYRLAELCGRFYCAFAKRDRKIVANNIRIILKQTSDEEKIYRISQMVFVNFAKYLVEFFRTPKIDLKYIDDFVKIEGKQNLDNALNLGKGVLIVSAHLGNWELAAMALSMSGYKINIVAWTHKNRSVNNFFLQQRQSKGVTIIPLGTGVRRVLSALENNEVVAILGDIDYVNPGMGIAVKFFGQDTIMPKGPAAFSLKMSCPIIMGFMLREKNNKFRFVLGEPIMYEPSGNQEYDLLKITKEISRRMESCIAQYPAQWFMFSSRWQRKSYEK